jgi:hypothetical protein
MRQPESLFQQYQGKAMAELFRGSGRWPFQKHPCHLEPPWEPYDRHVLTEWDCYVNNWEGPWAAGMFGQRVPTPVVRPADSPLLLAPWPSSDFEFMWNEIDRLSAITIEQFPEDDATIPKAQQFLLSCPALKRPVAFQLLGLGPQPVYDGLTEPSDILDARREARPPSGWTEPWIVVQFVAHRSDIQKLEHQLVSHYPNSAVVVKETLNRATDLLPAHDLMQNIGYGRTLALTETYDNPLTTFRNLDNDPLNVAIAAMEQLERYEWALLQVLFCRSEQSWADSLRAALRDPYHANQLLFNDVSESQLNKKFASPLFAASVRVAALKQSTWQHLLGWAQQFANGNQELASLANTDENYSDFGFSLMAACTFQPGILLNIEELAGLVHLPSSTIHSERLRRIQTRTRPAQPSHAEVGSVILGDNIHRGQRKVARIPASLRARHCYVAGASGTGKSTLLLNMIVQDIEDGEGVGVLDPHGDLINAVLPRIPRHRVEDVILFDATDEEYPFALNILSAADAQERERIVSETLMSLERYFPDSWGPRLERILTFAIHTVLAVDPSATLNDVERMMIDDDFRRSIIARTTVPRFRLFWDDEFIKFPKNAVDPVLNKLSVFLMSRTVRNIVCQRHCAIDFDQVLNRQKILLVNLSTGLLTEKIANILGSFVVTKIVNAAFRRAILPHSDRRPWYLYIDEFQNFMNTSVGFERILAEARKYNLCLAGLANQYVGQLSHSVRQAIFGNIGVMVAFRMGVEDANIVAKEMGVFEASEIMNLEVGQAIARAGGSKTAYNLVTFPDPPHAERNASADIKARMHQHYARQRWQVEDGLNLPAQSSDGKSLDKQGTGTSRHRQSKPKTTSVGTYERSKSQPQDPNEDDFVN